MSIIEHAPATAHKFEDCNDPECREELCRYYRAGLAAGHDFMQGSEARLARVRATAREAGGKASAT